MDAGVREGLVMCGGSGSRLDTPDEKPLVEVDGTPMVDRVLAALEASGVQHRYAAVSPAAPATRGHLADRAEVDIIETPGEGYVPDLQTALADLRGPVVTLAADVPLLAGDLVDRIRAAYTAGSMTVVVPVAVKRQLGVSVASDTVVDGHAPTGVNIVDTADTDNQQMYVSYDVRLAVNVNRVRDLETAEAIACA